MFKIVVLIVVLFLNSCSHSSEPAKKTNLSDNPECTSNSDCISVARRCCGCTAGGSNKALSTKDHKNWLAARAKNCALTICPSVISKDETCTASAVCIKGKCELKRTETQ